MRGKTAQKRRSGLFFRYNSIHSLPLKAMSKTFFAPAPAGLDAEQLAARQQREHDSNNAIATLMSNGPAPSPEALALMQRHVDGELTIEQVITLTDEMLLARYSGKAASGQVTEAAQ